MYNLISNKHCGLLRAMFFLNTSLGTFKICLLQHRDNKILDSIICKPLLLTDPFYSSSIPNVPVQSDFSEGEFVHATKLLHGDLEGVFIGVVLDDVVIHVDQNPVTGQI